MLTTNATHTATSYEIDFKIKDVESVVVSALSKAPATVCTINTSADVSDPGKYNNSSSANTLLGSTDKNTLIFPLPQSPIKETTIAGNTVSYSFKKVSKSLSSDSDGTLSITLPDFQFMPGAGALTRNDARENFIVVVKTNENNANTYVNAYSSGSSPDATNSRLLVTGDYIDLGALKSDGSSIRPVTITSNRKTCRYRM